MWCFITRFSKLVSSISWANSNKCMIVIFAPPGDAGLLRKWPHTHCPHDNRYSKTSELLSQTSIDCKSSGTSMKTTSIQRRRLNSGYIYTCVLSVFCGKEPQSSMAAKSKSGALGCSERSAWLHPLLKRQASRLGAEKLKSRGKSQHPHPSSSAPRNQPNLKVRLASWFLSQGTWSCAPSLRTQETPVGDRVGSPFL